MGQVSRAADGDFGVRIVPTDCRFASGAVRDGGPRVVLAAP